MSYKRGAIYPSTSSGFVEGTKKEKDASNKTKQNKMDKLLYKKVHALLLKKITLRDRPYQIKKFKPFQDQSPVVSGLAVRTSAKRVPVRARILKPADTRTTRNAVLSVGCRTRSRWCSWS